MAKATILKLDFDEETIFKKEVKKRLIDLDLTYSDLAMRTGYNDKSVSNMLSANAEVSKFFVMAAVDSLGLDINEIRRKAKDGK